MPTSVFAAGMLLGLSIAAPVGPMGLLCINRTLAGGLAAGLAIGAGIAVGDAAYGAIAAFGFAAVTDALVAHAGALRLIGGGFLIWMGVNSWRRAGRPGPARGEARTAGRGMAVSFVIAVGLTLSNPATMLSFIAAFGALGLAGRAGGAMPMVAGVFLGSALWWLVLSSAVSLARRALTPAMMRHVDHLSAAILIGFGAAAAANLL